MERMICTLYHLQCRNFVGNDLDPLSVKELQSLEQQLDTSLKRIRTRKVKNAYNIWNQRIIISTYNIWFFSSIDWLIWFLQNQVMNQSISELHKRVRDTCIYIESHKKFTNIFDISLSWSCACEVKPVFIFIEMQVR
jgi:hypothetical protein